MPSPTGIVIESAAARSEVSRAYSLRSKTFHQRADDAVAARIPSSRNDAHGSMLLCGSRERAAQVKNRCVNVEAIHSIDAQSEALQRMFLDGTRRRCQDGNIHLTKLRNVLHYFIFSQFRRLIATAITANYACNLHVWRCLQSLHRVLSNVSVTNDGNSQFLHVLLSFCLPYLNFGDKGIHF